MRRVLAILLVSACLSSGLPAPLGAAEESQEGRLRILLNGEAIGSEHYQITRTPTEIHAQGEVELRVGDQRLRQSASLLLAPDLAPRRYEWKIEEPKGSWLRMQFEGTVGTITFQRLEGKEEQQVFDFGTPRVALLDVNVFHHFLLLAQLYDFAAGGPQTIKVFVPQSIQPGEAKVELQKVETLTVDGQPQAVRQLAITTEDNQLLLWVTESGRFVRLSAPQQKVEVVPEAAAP